MVTDAGGEPIISRGYLFGCLAQKSRSNRKMVDTATKRGSKDTFSPDRYSRKIVLFQGESHVCVIICVAGGRYPATYPFPNDSGNNSNRYPRIASPWNLRIVLFCMAGDDRCHGCFVLLTCFVYLSSCAWSVRKKTQVKRRS